MKAPIILLRSLEAGDDVHKLVAFVFLGTNVAAMSCHTIQPTPTLRVFHEAVAGAFSSPNADGDCNYMGWVFEVGLQALAEDSAATGLAIPTRTRYQLIDVKAGVPRNPNTTSGLGKQYLFPPVISSSQVGAITSLDAASTTLQSHHRNSAWMRLARSEGGGKPLVVHGVDQLRSRTVSRGAETSESAMPRMQNGRPPLFIADSGTKLWFYHDPLTRAAGSLQIDQSATIAARELVEKI
ncbi:hypothetical protein BD779DRAFT_1478833 [Infundibulicybe gibba]|nr:hypothetical protein BD779DRAFT_1478833 [Infundibulicybe gibba]